MRKVFLFMMVSLDGYFEGENHDLTWHNVDAEFNEFAIAQTNSVDTLLFGRRTYELMSSYWQSEHALSTDPIVAKQMNEKPKIVFSHSLNNADWINTRLVTDNTAKEIEKLKDQPGKDIGIYGSNNLCVSLMQSKLVDEFRIMVNPVIIGKGSLLFEGVQDKLDLTLIDTHIFKSDNVLLTYRPAS